MSKNLQVWLGIIISLFVITSASYAGFVKFDNRYAKAPDLAAMKNLIDTQALYFEQKFYIEQKKDIIYNISRLERTPNRTRIEEDMLQRLKFELDNVLREIRSIQNRMDALKQSGG